MAHPTCWKPVLRNNKERLGKMPMLRDTAKMAGPRGGYYSGKFGVCQTFFETTDDTDCTDLRYFFSGTKNHTDIGKHTQKSDNNRPNNCRDTNNVR